MPVIRFTGSAKVTVFTKEDRAALTEQLQRELAGEATDGRTVIFENPADRDGQDRCPRCLGEVEGKRGCTSDAK